MHSSFSVVLLFISVSGLGFILLLSCPFHLIEDPTHLILHSVTTALAKLWLFLQVLQFAHNIYISVYCILHKASGISCECLIKTISASVTLSVFDPMEYFVLELHLL